WIGLALALKNVVPIWWVGDAGWGVDPMRTLLETNVWLLVFNLLPLFPMDGGRVLRGLLARWKHPNLATLWVARLGAFGAIGFIGWGATQKGGVQGTLLIFIGLSNLFACIREMQAARYSDGPYGEPLDPWALDPEGWKTGSWRSEGAPRRGW